MHRRRDLIAAGAAALLAAACASTGQRVADATAAARDMALTAGLEWQEVRSGRFTIATAHRGLGAPELVVYLEGDGRAFETRRRPSSDPTPSAPMGLRLATLDRSPGVLYVARPCQFVGARDRGGCRQTDWTGARYSEAIVGAIDAVIDRAAAAGGARTRTVLLVGYSGGGAVAALLAARRSDVSCLVTVAANLDLAHWTRVHRLAPLEGSLDPAGMPALRDATQVHLAGADDARVPPEVLDAFLARVRPGNSIRHVLPGFDHDCCWASAWPIVPPGTPPACQLPR